MDIYVQNRRLHWWLWLLYGLLGTTNYTNYSNFFPKTTDYADYGDYFYPQINANYTQIILLDIYVIFTRIGGGKQPRIARIIIYPQINANYTQIIY